MEQFEQQLVDLRHRPGVPLTEDTSAVREDAEHFQFVVANDGRSPFICRRPAGCSGHRRGWSCGLGACRESATAARVSAALDRGLLQREQALGDVAADAVAALYRP